MKRFLFPCLSALFLTTTTAAIVLPALSTPLAQPSALASRNLLVTRELSVASVPVSRVPTITSSVALGNHHIIRVAVAGMTVKDLMITIPKQMEGYSSVQVTDRQGKVIPAQVSTSKRQVTIVFDQPIKPGNSVEVDFMGVPLALSGGEVLEYGVSARRQGLNGTIPVGTARIQVPSRE